MLSSGEVDTTFAARDEIETEGLTIETVWAFKEGKYRTKVLVNWEVLVMYRSTGMPMGFSRMICYYWSDTVMGARRIHEDVVNAVYLGSYAIDLEMKLENLTPVDVQEDVS